MMANTRTRATTACTGGGSAYTWGGGGRFLRVPYLLRTSSMSCNAACRERVPSPCADVGAPLGALAWGLASLRFAAEGDWGAGGSVGGVRVPLAAAIVTWGCCLRCASDGVGCNALRAAEVVVSRSPRRAFLAATLQGARRKTPGTAQPDTRWLAVTRNGPGRGRAWWMGVWQRIAQGWLAAVVPVRAAMNPTRGLVPSPRHSRPATAPQPRHLSHSAQATHCHSTHSTALAPELPTCLCPRFSPHPPPSALPRHLVAIDVYAPRSPPRPPNECTAFSSWQLQVALIASAVW